MIYVVGNSVAALSAVATISQREEVTWLQKPGRKGGVFGGIEIDGISCDIGMLNFELGAATNRKTNSVVEYDRQRINDCANFSQIIDDFVSQFCKRIPLQEPKMLFSGELIPDFLYGHRLDVLDQFGESVSVAIDNYEPDLFELFHPRNKYNGDPSFEKLSYQYISARLLGSQVIDEIINPWLNKTIGESASNLPAFKHRAAWAPLYWPESIINSNRNSVNDIGLSASFSYPEIGSFSSLIREMYAMIELSDRVRVVLSDKTFTAIMFDALAAIDCEKVVACEPLSIGGAGSTGVAGGPPKSSVDLHYLEVGIGSALDDIYVVNSCEEHIPWYRVSVSDGRINSNSIKVCLESKSGTFAGQPSIEELQLSELGISMGNCTIVGSFLNTPALNLVDNEWDLQYEADLMQVKTNYPNISFIGGAGGRWGNTFSDQIIQGIKEGQIE